MRGIIFLLIIAITAYATSPKTFNSFAKQYEENRKKLAVLKNHAYFKPYVKIFKTYENAIDTCYSVGYELDDAIDNKKGNCDVLKKVYLSKLRRLQKDKNGIEKIYVQALDYAMANDDTALFELLVSAPMKPLYKSRLTKKVLGYYKKQEKLQNIKLLDTLEDDLKLEEKSRQIFKQEQELYEEHLNVIKAEEARKLRLMTADKRVRNVVVSTEAFENGYHFIAENFNAYEVTIEIILKDMNNYMPSVSLPLVVELKAHTKVNILDVTQIDKHKKAWFKSQFSWAMGSYTAVHNDDYLYRLPFAKGQRVGISQGYHGNTSHKGLSAYAIDFQVVEGTPVYAARDGKVVALYKDSNEGGFSKRFRSKANYVVIEHDDRTLAKYYHLKKNGVFVHVGEQVHAGDKIGLSGNTGYSSGPHLHFSVSKVDEKTHKRAKTIPTLFKTKEGILREPKRSQYWSVI